MLLDLTRTKNMQGLDPSSCVNMTFAKYVQVIETPCKVLRKNFNPGAPLGSPSLFSLLPPSSIYKDTRAINTAKLMQ